jgi:hypothetical protein
MSEKYDRAAEVWAIRSAIYGKAQTGYYPDKVWKALRRHVAASDCQLCLAPQTKVEFSYEQDGGCETCSTTYAVAEFMLTCTCGKGDRTYFSYDLKGVDMGQLLQDILEAEEQHPPLLEEDLIG